MPDPRSRYIGDQHSAIVEQALLNMVLRGDLRVIRKGVDVTQSIQDQSERINSDYDLAIEPQNKANVEAPRPPKPRQFADPVKIKPSAMPKKTEPKPPRKMTSHAHAEGESLSGSSPP